MDVCPVKIDSAEVTLSVRSYLEREGVTGSPWKSRMLQLWSRDSEFLPWAAKAAAVGQTIQNTAVRFIPPFWRRRMKNPVFQGPGPKLGMTNIYEKVGLSEGNLIIPGDPPAGESIPGVFYFPGCGSGLFYAGIGLAGLFLLLESGYAVLLPEEHKCCGYPLLSEGCTGAYKQNRDRNREFFQGRINLAAEENVQIRTLLTSCGTCRASLEGHGLEELSPSLRLMDVFQFLFPDFQGKSAKRKEDDSLIYHSSCHSAWSEVPQKEADAIYTSSLQECLAGAVERSPHCCAESGLGALTAPAVYNRLRKRKRAALEEALGQEEDKSTVLVSCPSCKIGLNRIMGSLPHKAKIQHTLEYLADCYYGMHWGHVFAEKLKEEWTQRKISTS
jgi:Fe-S oxidoreductase